MFEATALTTVDIKMTLGHFICTVGIISKTSMTINLNYIIERMQKSFLVLFSLITIYVTFGQNVNFKLLNKSEIYGKDLVNNSPIIANEYSFPMPIYGFHIDSLSRAISLQLRLTSGDKKTFTSGGELVYIDLNTDEITWRKRINYQKSRVQHLSGILTQTSNRECYALNFRTGEELWRNNYNLFLSAPKKKIVVGFERYPENSNKLFGINITNGKPIWKREINRASGAIKVEKLNDSILIILSNGLHTVNIKNGLGFDYTTKTSELDYTAFITTRSTDESSGPAFRALYYNKPQTIGNLHSNVLTNEDGELIFASREKVTSIKKNGAESWSINLPKDKASKSILFQNDSVVFMINTGLAEMNNKDIIFGKPFLVSINKTTGKIIKQISFKEELPIKDFKIAHDTITIISFNNIALYSSKTGDLITNKKFLNPKEDEFTEFITRGVLTHINDSTYSHLIDTDPTLYFVRTKNGVTYAINHKLELVNQIAEHDLQYAYNKMGSYTIITEANKTLVLDKYLSKVVSLDIPKVTQIIGKKFYCFTNDRYVKIDLSEVLLDR